MLRPGIRSRTGVINDEHGASMAEYIPLIGLIAILAIIAVTFLGPWVSDQLGDATVPLDPDACPTGWSLAYADVEKTKDRAVNKNGDPYVCEKAIPGNGKGNTGEKKNVKDNKRAKP